MSWNSNLPQFVTYSYSTADFPLRLAMVGVHRSTSAHSNSTCCCVEMSAFFITAPSTVSRPVYIKPLSERQLPAWKILFTSIEAVITRDAWKKRTAACLDKAFWLGCFWNMRTDKNVSGLQQSHAAAAFDVFGASDCFTERWASPQVFSVNWVMSHLSLNNNFHVKILFMADQLIQHYFNCITINNQVINGRMSVLKYDSSVHYTQSYHTNKDCLAKAPAMCCAFQLL